MSALSSVPSHSGAAGPHAEFLQLYPLVERHAQFVFRGRPRAERDEAVAEAVAAAFASYVRLKARGKDPVHDFPWAVAIYATLHVKDGRHVGGRSSSQDALARKAQRRRAFSVEPLLVSTRTSHESLYATVRGQREQDAFEERLRDNVQTPVPEQVAFRLDFPAFLRTLTERDRQLALALAAGQPAKEVAHRWGLSPGRITQLRQQWHREWRGFQGETPEAKADLQQVAVAV
jgi:hypothetical protein